MFHVMSCRHFYTLNLNTPTEKAVVIELSDGNKDIMQYVAGFVLHSVKRKT